MNQPTDNNCWLHRFAVLTALATLALIAIGGLVTSHEAGMSVPDWPNSYGYNMFLFPPSKWVGGILYEHTHRLWASMVGLLIVALTRWLGGNASRKPLAIVGAIEVLAGIAIFALRPDLKATGGFLTGIGGIVLLAALDMFLFPPLKWVGGVLYKHTPRLWAAKVALLVSGRGPRKTLAIVGLLGVLAGIVILTVWPTQKVPGSLLASIGGMLLFARLVWFRNEAAPRPLPQLGWVVFFIVQVQGLLGGLRVVLFKDQIGIFHATLAQIFFVLTCLIALMTSKWWIDRENIQHPTSNIEHPMTPVASLRGLFVATTFLILFQLILGATMRHQHAGLAIRDFPLAYGKLWPATDAASVIRYNEHRIEITNFNPITAFQIQLQMVHRIVAILILGAVGFCAWSAWRKRFGPVAKLSAFWFALILCQAGLGAATVLLDKAADVATAHVLIGALSLATGAALSIIALRFSQSAVDVPSAESILKGAPGLNFKGAIEVGSAGKMPAAR